MADDDDWESFSVPTFSAPAGASAVVVDDDEDLTLLEEPKIATPSASQQEAARKKAALEAEALASRVEFALLENETPEEKKVRERKQAEEAEAHMVANDLGGSVGAALATSRGSAVNGIASIPLKNKKDHETFAITVANKLSGSTSVCTAAFVSELTNRLKSNITTEGLETLLMSLQVGPSLIIFSLQVMLICAS